MATLTRIGNGERQPIETRKTPILDSVIAKATNDNSGTDRSLMATPSRFAALAINGHTAAGPSQKNPSRSPTDSRTTANLRTSRQDSPSILSSRSVCSVASSSSNISNIWDSPQTPCHGSNEKFRACDLTPITPPTPLSPITREELFKILTPSRVASTSTGFTNGKDDIDRASEQDGGTESLVKEEEFEPKKLIRGLTAEFLAIAAANATSAQDKYNLTPNFDFSMTSIHSASALLQKGTRCHPKVSNNAKSWGKSRDGEPRTSIVVHEIPSWTDVRTLVTEIIPCDLKMRLKEAPLQCVASLIKKPQKRCTYNAKAPSEFDKRRFKSLAHCTDGILMDEIVDNIIQTIFCGTHKNSAKRRLENLQRPVAGPTHVADKELPHSSSLEKLRPGCESHQIALPEKKDFQKKDIPPARIVSITTEAATVRAAIIPTRPGPSLTDSYSLAFRSYRPKKWEGISVQDALHATIIEPLKPTDLKVGFIYIFWDVQHFGMVKIGRTNDLQARLKQWDRDCKRKHKYHTKLPEIPHVSRVERLIHMELKQQRKVRRCESCNKTHKEWFEVNEAHAVTVFQKWQQWIAQEPYELDVRSGEWMLKPEMLASVSQLCEPVLLPAPANNRQTKPPRRSSRLASQQKRSRRS